MQIRGSCHCGNICFVLDWRPEPLEIPARACTCSFCMKHGGIWTACPAGSLQVDIRDASRVSRYSFETRTADFHICTVCGVVPLVTSAIDGQTYAVVNVNTLEDVEPSMLKPASVSFEGEDEATRLRRRAKGWIATVRFSAKIAE